MFENNIFLKKTSDKIKKVAKIGALMSLGGGAMINGGNAEAQEQNIDVITEFETQRNADREWLASPERYNLAKKQDISGEERETQTNQEKLLEHNIKLVKNKLVQVKNRIFLDLTKTPAEIVSPTEEEIKERETEIKECEEYLINPSLEIKKVCDIEFDDLSNLEKNKEVFNFYDEKIKKIAEHISSQEYLDKLTLEYGNEEKAKAHQKVRLSNLYNGTYSLTDKTSHFSSDDNDFETQLPKDTSLLVTAADHEVLGHKIVGGGYSSKKAGDLLIRSYQKFDPNSKYFKDLIKATNQKDSDDIINYLGNYFGEKAERYAYKQGLEMEMISRGVKKYGEKFTQEHYKKLIDLYNNNKLSPESCRFIETTKPEYFEQIFNEIAENNNKSEKTFYNPDWNYNQREDKA